MQGEGLGSGFAWEQAVLGVGCTHVPPSIFDEPEKSASLTWTRCTGCEQSSPDQPRLHSQLVPTQTPLGVVHREGHVNEQSAPPYPPEHTHTPPAQLPRREQEFGHPAVDEATASPQSLPL